MYEKLTKNALKCMYIATGITMMILIAIFVVVSLIFIDDKDLMFISVIMWGLSVAALVNAAISPIIRFNRYRYKIDNECIDIEEGYIFVKREIVPIERLHKLNISRGPIDRICNVAKVIVTTAGGDVTIRFLDEDRANVITEGLMKRINEIVKEEKEQSLEMERQLKIGLDSIETNNNSADINENTGE